MQVNVFWNYQRRQFTLCLHKVYMAAELYKGSTHAHLYAQYRPTYPSEIYKLITSYYETGKGRNCNYDLAVDVGCGNGQNTLPLRDYFRHVIGIDASKQQIESALKADLDNLNFRVGAGEDLSFLENNSVDVVTVAQALHWLNREVFYKEVARVLKPGGVLAAYGYARGVLDDSEAEQWKKEFYAVLDSEYMYHSETIARRHAEEHRYRKFELPFPNYERIDHEDISIKKTMPVDAYVGYLSSLSSWQQYVKVHRNSDSLVQLQQRLKSIYGNQSKHNSTEMMVYWPGFMLIGRKPK